MPPQKMGMTFTYTTKTHLPLTPPPPPPVRKNAYTKMGGFQTANTMNSIMRMPASSCSSCGH